LKFTTEDGDNINREDKKMNEILKILESLADKYSKQGSECSETRDKMVLVAKETAIVDAMTEILKNHKGHDYI